MDLRIFEEEWKKIPYNSKIFIFFGVTLVLLTWLIDHWGGANSYTFYRVWGFDIRSFSFSLGVTIILLVFVFAIVKQGWTFKRILAYRLKYPLERLGKDFHLIWFNGKLILFDVNEKLYHHVSTWETAQDLYFVGHGESVEKSFDEVNNESIHLPSGNSLNISEYRDGGQLNSRA